MSFDFSNLVKKGVGHRIVQDMAARYNDWHFFVVDLFHKPLFLPRSKISSIEIKKEPTKDNIFGRLYSRVTKSEYALITLKQLTQQNIVIPWSNKFEKFVPPLIFLFEKGEKEPLDIFIAIFYIHFFTQCDTE